MKYYNQIVFTFKNDNNFFFIAVAPESVTITGDDSGKVGDVKAFSCETSNSNPPATIQWVVDGRTVPSTFTTTVSFLLPNHFLLTYKVCSDGSVR